MHLVEQRGDLVEALQRIVLELFHEARHGLGAALAVVVVLFVVLVEVFLGHVVVVLVQVGKAVDHGVDDDLAFTDVGGHLQDLGDRGGAGADGFHHRHQAPFDALGDLDLALAREQLHGAHLAHVHAHRVGGAAEFRIDGGQRRLGLFLGLFLGGGAGALVGQQQRLRVRRLLVHGHAQVVQHGDHGLQRLDVDQLVGQVVVDLAVRQVAARLAELEQGLEVGAAGAHLLFGEHALVEAEFLHQGAFLGLADLHAQGLGLFDRGLLTLGRRLGLAFQVGFNVRQVGVLVQVLGRRLAGAAALGGCGFFGGCGTLGRAAHLLGGGGGRGGLGGGLPGRGGLGRRGLEFFRGGLGRRGFLGRRLLGGGALGGGGLGGRFGAGGHQSTSGRWSAQRTNAMGRRTADTRSGKKRKARWQRRADGAVWRQRTVRGKMVGRTFGVQSLRYLGRPWGKGRA